MIARQYDCYGKINGTIPDDIKKGDVVSYIDVKYIWDSDNYCRIKNEIKLVGIWDGEKVEFDDNDKTVVRTIHYLKLEK